MHFDLTTAIPVLERTPAALRAMLAGLPTAWTEATEGPGTWSPHVVLAHLLHADLTNWMPRARVILDGDHARVLPAFDPAGQFHEATARTFTELLDAFDQTRAENLARLTSWRVGPTELQRTGRHPEFGTVTLSQLLATWVTHDLAHVTQVARVMARQYRDAVGPWRVYLPILGA
jgi:hypothetical protein